MTSPRRIALIVLVLVGAVVTTTNAQPRHRPAPTVVIVQPAPIVPWTTCRPRCPTTSTTSKSWRSAGLRSRRLARPSRARRPAVHGSSARRSRDESVRGSAPHSGTVIVGWPGRAIACSASTSTPGSIATTNRLQA